MLRTTALRKQLLELAFVTSTMSSSAAAPSVPWSLFDDDEDDNQDHEVEDSGSSVMHEAAPHVGTPAGQTSTVAASAGGAPVTSAPAAFRGPARVPVPLQYTLRTCVDFVAEHVTATEEDLAELVGKTSSDVARDTVALAALTLTQLQAVSYALRTIADATLPTPPPPPSSRRGGGQKGRGKRAVAAPPPPPQQQKQTSQPPKVEDAATLLASLTEAADALHATTWGWLESHKSWPHVALREAFVFASLARAVAAGASGGSAEEGMAALDLALIMGAPARELAPLFNLYDRACLMEAAANAALTSSSVQRPRLPRRIPALLGPHAVFTLPPELVALAEVRHTGTASPTSPHHCYARRVGGIPSAVTFSATADESRRGGRGKASGLGGAAARSARLKANRQASARTAAPAAGTATRGTRTDNDHDDEDDSDDDEEEEHPTLAALRMLDDRTPLSLAEFRRRFVKGSQPVVLAGVMRGWPALRRWRDLEALAERYGHRTVPVEHGIHLAAGWREEPMRLRDFFTSFIAPSVRDWGKGASANPHKIAYLAQHGLFEQLPDLLDDFTVPTYAGDDVGAVNAWFGTAGT